MIKMYDSVFDLMIELMPFFMLPVAIMILSHVARMIRDLMRIGYGRDTAKELMKENDKLIQEEKEKISIDKDLQKYFNYKE